MIDPTYILLSIAGILIFGSISEFIFKKTRIPDVLFLIILGYAIGPFGFKIVDPSKFSEFAPIFTTFALLFLLYDGAFNIDLGSFARGLTKSLGITIFNFIISATTITGILYLFGFKILIALLTGFILGGISSAFVIPLIKQLKIKKETYSILTLESAITDVLCIVFALTTIEIISLNSFSAQITLGKIVGLFAVAGAIGIIAGIIWIAIVATILKENKSYMITIAYLIIVYVVAELLNGNGAIAALFFGLILRNSKELTAIFKTITQDKGRWRKNKKIIDERRHGLEVISPEEQFFYSEISFFLKTFFFVYIGTLINFTNTTAITIGAIIAIALFIVRKLSFLLTKKLEKYDRSIVNAIFARGLAAAAVAQLVFSYGLPEAQIISSITYAVITFSIILSSANVFYVNLKHKDH